MNRHQAGRVRREATVLAVAGISETAAPRRSRSRRTAATGRGRSSTSAVPCLSERRSSVRVGIAVPVFHQGAGAETKRPPA